jgi:ABC-type multidrug transport system fused ATPase/permease subunit
MDKNSFCTFLTAFPQLLGVTEKLWIKVFAFSLICGALLTLVQTWGEAYNHSKSSAGLYAFRSFATTEHELTMDGLLSPHAFTSNLLPIFSSRSLLGIQWPSPYEHPLFYVGVYATIGLTAAIVSITSVSVQFAGALRASRQLFKQLLVGVVHATMRWHDTTPQGRVQDKLWMSDHLNWLTFLSTIYRSHA